MALRASAVVRAAATATASSSSRRATRCPTVHHELFSPPGCLPAGHRFPMDVFGRIAQRLRADGRLTAAAEVRPPDAPAREELLLAHDAEHVDKFLEGRLDDRAVRRIGLPWSEALVARTLAEVAGTMHTAELALAHGLAVSTAGGTHHAHPGFGSGFCILNDLAVTARTLLEAGRVRSVLVVDLDVHQGDGTAACLAGEDRAYVLDVFCEDNFPYRKHPATAMVPLPRGTGDGPYLANLGAALRDALAASRPDLVLFDAGVDTHAADRLGLLELTDDGLARRERLVLDTVLAHEVPIAAFVGGGYDASLDVLAERHCVLHEAAAEMHEAYGLTPARPAA